MDISRRTLLRSVGALSAAGATFAVAGCSTGDDVALDGAGSEGAAGGGGGSATLIAAIAGEPDQLDPNATSAYFSFQVLENVFDTLVEPDENLEMQPALAESWETSDDQLTWTFTLKDGITFHDGKELTAEDVVYTYTRIMDEELSNAWRFAAVESVEAPDPRTVVITVSAPSPNLLSNLGGFKGMAIVSRENVESGEITTSPIGTGPFRLTEYASGDHISLQANPDFWGGAPELGGVEFRFMSEGSTALTALQNGEIQWTDSIEPQQVQGLEGSDTVTLGQTPSNDYWYLAMNQANAPWSDVQVRQAVAYAIERDAILQATSFGTAIANQLAIPEASIWYHEYAPYSTDPERAQQLFDEAGFTGGTMRFLATSDYPETVTTAQLLADALSPFGITVDIQTVDFATWLDRQGTGDFDILMMGWLGNIDPSDFYRNQHHSEGTSNYHGYSNPEVDELLDQGQVETDQETRKGLYDQAAEIICDDCSYIYLYNPAVIQVWSPELSGYEARADAAVRFRDASLSA